MLGLTGVTGFPRVLRARGMRIFYTKEKSQGFTTWYLAAGLSQSDPMFAYQFAYADSDPRDEIAEQLRDFKGDFLDSVFGYYRENTCH